MLHQGKSLYIATAIPLYKGIFLFFIVIYIKSRWCVCVLPFPSVSFGWVITKYFQRFRNYAFYLAHVIVKTLGT